MLCQVLDFFGVDPSKGLDDSQVRDWFLSDSEECFYADDQHYSKQPTAHIIFGIGPNSELIGIISHELMRSFLLSTSLK